MITSIQALLDKAVIGRKIARQPGIHEDFWGTTIVEIRPCDLDCGIAGFLIKTDRVGGCSSFTVLAEEKTIFDQ
jgi:hypothetical protein